MQRRSIWLALAATALMSCDFTVSELAADGPVVPVSASELDVPVRFVIRNSSRDTSTTGVSTRKVKLAVRYRQNPRFIGLPFVAAFKIRDAGGSTLTPDGTTDAAGFSSYWWIDLASLAAIDATTTIRATARVRCPTAECSSVTLVVEFDSCAGEEFSAPQCRIREDNEANNQSPPLQVNNTASCANSNQLGTIFSSFQDCHSANAIGQSRGAGGVTCAQVCCAFGYSGCSHRGAQAGFDACVSPGSLPVGGCGDVFGAAWSSQCICAP